MRPFTYERAESVEAAAKAGAEPGARYLAGGTNLLDLMKLDIERPTHLIDIGRLPLSAIEATADGGLRLGALASNTAVAIDPTVRARYPLLSQALTAGGSPQLRNKASLAGNLMQRTRCNYFTDTSKPCNKRQPGSGCAALEGLNRNAAILGASPHCVATHASDLAVALAALDAEVETRDAKGAARRIAVADLHRLPGDAPQIETEAAPGELITAVVVPPPPPGGQVYRKARDRAAYSGGLASVAVVGNRVALGMVALKPWRATAAEAALASGASPAEAMAAELAGASPLAGNAFKVPLVARLGAAAITEAKEAVR